MDELKIAAAIIYSAMIEKGNVITESIDNDQSRNANNYWRLYNFLKQNDGNPDKDHS